MGFTSRCRSKNWASKNSIWNFNETFLSQRKKQSFYRKKRNSCLMLPTTVLSEHRSAHVHVFKHGAVSMLYVRIILMLLGKCCKPPWILTEYETINAPVLSSCWDFSSLVTEPFCFSLYNIHIPSYLFVSAHQSGGRCPPQASCI